MKIYILAAALFAVAGCNAAPPQNNIQDVAANNMIADDVTEVQDDSATSPPEDHAQAPAKGGNRAQ